LRANPIDDRRQKRLESNERKLEQQRSDLLNIKMRELTPEIKTLEVRYKALKNQISSLFQNLQYTQ
jgi:hypothetical protein